MLTLKQFCDGIEAYRKERSNSDLLSETIEKFADGYVVFTDTPCAEYVLKLLGEEMNDTEDMIGWWLFEDVKKEVYLSDIGDTYRIETAEDLYWYLTIISNRDNDYTWFITEHIIGTPDEEMIHLVYPEICRDPDRFIESLGKKDGYIYRNMCSELKILKEDARKE